MGALAPPRVWLFRRRVRLFWLEFGARMHRRLALLAPLLVGAALGTSATAGPRDGACGRPGKAACPLQAWMRQHVAAPLAKRDFGALASSFEKVARLNPDAERFTHWERLANEGAAAARRQMLPKVTTSCSRCHELYRAKYNERHRARRIEN